MKTRALVIAAVCTSGAAWAEHRVAEAEPHDDQVVVVNAAAKLGDLGQIARLRRALDSRGLLFKLPDQLAATLDGRNAQISDLDAIKDAYASVDYATALKIIDEDERRVLGSAANGDLIPALAELSQWRGMIAAALDQQEEAVRQFRAAYRFNPAWTPDKKLASPRVRAMVKKARREVDEVGTLRVEADPDEALVSVDGGEARAASDKLKLQVGIHLVMVTAPSRAPYAELVEIRHGDPYRLQIALDKETKLDRAARLVDETAAAPPGKQRLKRAGALSRLTGVHRMLVVEDGGDDHVTVRLYDVSLDKVSRPLDLAGTASSAAIARQVAAALDVDNLVDVSTLTVAQPRSEPQRWYQRWYVWAGAAVLLGGGIASYEYLSRDPTSVRGF